MSQALLSYEDAVALVAAQAAKLALRKPRTERVALEQAVGRVLARPIIADRDQPAFARSTRDGFACRAAEINVAINEKASAHLPLVVAGSSRAGDVPGGPLPAGAAWEIMTGAPMPSGADAVVMIEHVALKKNHVRLLEPRSLHAGQNVVARAAQGRKGDELLAAGVTLTWAQIALAAACGQSKLAVYARPRVAILTTGDEIVSVEAKPGPGKIRNSNAPMLAALVAAAGGDPWVLPTAADNATALDRALRQARKADLLLITGGVSAGKFDLVEPALKRLSTRFHFTGVKMQPGKPTIFGELPAVEKNQVQNQNRTKCCCFGLAGNPISSAVTFLLFAAPVLAALAGRAERGPRFALARLGEGPFRPAKSGLTRFLPAHFDQEGTVSFVPWQGSGDLSALGLSNCFIVLAPDAPPLKPGAPVRILLS